MPAADRPGASEGPLALDRYHSTAAGHACAVEAIARFVVEEGLVPGQVRFD